MKIKNIYKRIPVVHGLVKYRMFRPDHLKLIVGDIVGTTQPVHSNRDHIRGGADWLVLAHRKSGDGGVSRGYYFDKGWMPSHVGCAGDAAETLFAVSAYLDDPAYRQVAIAVCDWLVECQLECGGYHLNYVHEREPRVLNTGLAMFGLLRAYDETGNRAYLDAAIRGGEWLLSVQEPNGEWRKHNYIFKTDIFSYHAKTAWALYELYRRTGEERYLAACRTHLDWVLSCQLPNGFIEHASMTGDRDPHTHLIAYVLRGLVEVGIGLGDERYVDAARRAIEGIRGCFDRHGYVPATFNREWGLYNEFFRREVKTSCLCGDAEFSIVLQRLYEHTGDRSYFEFSAALNDSLKRMQDLTTTNENVRGALKGSSKVYGIFYERFGYVNWTIKFYLDALLLEEKNRPEVGR